MLAGILLLRCVEELRLKLTSAKVEVEAEFGNMSKPQQNNDLLHYIKSKLNQAPHLVTTFLNKTKVKSKIFRPVRILRAKFRYGRKGCNKMVTFLRMVTGHNTLILYL